MVDLDDLDLVGFDDGQFCPQCLSARLEGVGPCPKEHDVWRRRPPIQRRPRLTMAEFLWSVDHYGLEAREVLVELGHHPKVIYAKAEKAARKGYTEYGVVADRPWLTRAGRSFIDQVPPPIGIPGQPDDRPPPRDPIEPGGNVR